MKKGQTTKKGHLKTGQAETKLSPEKWGNQGKR